MRVQGSLQAPLPQSLKRRKQAPEKAGDQAASRQEVIRLTPDWDAAELSASARRALQGYWSVAHQGHLWAEWRRVDVYV